MIDQADTKDGEVSSSSLLWLAEEEEEDTKQEDTIYALSSGSGSTGQATAVAVVRISGPDASAILQQLCQPKVPLPQPRYATLRKLYRPITTRKHNESKDNHVDRASQPQRRVPLDQALVLYFPAPHSFTGEDCVELQCHGGRAVVTGILTALQHTGLARLAEPGEFTQRAFGHGKLDLLQIEALADLLAADTSAQRQQALHQLDGQLSTVYTHWRNELIAGLAHAEAVIDFGDDERLDDDVFASRSGSSMVMAPLLDQQQVNIWSAVVQNMQTLTESMRKQLSDQRRGELVREGVRIAIVGPPNAGKSSLFNVLAARDAAIVSPWAGTTRDVLEVALSLGGVKCLVQDTAGVRNHNNDNDVVVEADLIEQEGIQRAVRAAAQADFVVAMVDSTDCAAGLEIVQDVLTKITSRDFETRSNHVLNPKHVLLVLNKVDLRNGNDRADGDTSTAALNPFLDSIGGCFDVSCVTQQGIDSFLTDLTHRVRNRVGTYDVGTTGEVDNSDVYNEGVLITRARHRQHVKAAVEALERFAIQSQYGSVAVDMAAEELRLAASELGRITGAIDVEDVLDKLFSDFCIGK